MLFLADENIPLMLIDALKEAGHDVVSAQASSPGLQDRKIVEWAATQSRVCITFDKDFGELASREPVVRSFGIILLRVPMPPPAEMHRLADIIAARTDWAGHLSIIEPGRTRMRPLVDRLTPP